ncbi:MAG TPA: DMT family transporter [Thermoanaerobaculia bacterium]|nr:DMT family transporter [Thermoanaerobaculia bacterium]
MADLSTLRAAERAQTIRAIAILLAASAAFGLMAFTAKLATERIGGAQTAMIRFAVGLMPILLVPWLRRAAFRFQRLDLLLYRGIFGGLAVLLYFLAIEHIPVGVATLLNYTSPIFAGAFAAGFIGEPVRGRIAIPLAIALAGVFLVVRSHALPGERIGFGRWEAAALGSAVLAGAALTAIRMARRTEGSWAIFASLSLFGLLATAPFAIPVWTAPSPREWALLIGVGVISIVAQILMTHAYRWVETLVAGVVSQFGVIVAMSLGAIFLAEPITSRSLLGTALTITGVVLAIAATSRRGVEPAPASLPPA